MANYVNPYMGLGYGVNSGYPAMQYSTVSGLQPIQPMMQQSYAAPPMQTTVKSVEWVDGEIGAKAYQIPVGWPANTPIALWDSTDTVIYLKSVNQMGVPNPMQKLRYTMEEQPNLLTSGTAAGGDVSGNHDMSQYVTKQDFDQLRMEIQKMAQEAHNGNNQMSNQNGSNNGRNRGGQ